MTYKQMLRTKHPKDQRPSVSRRPCSSWTRSMLVAFCFAVKGRRKGQRSMLAQKNDEATPLCSFQASNVWSWRFAAARSARGHSTRRGLTKRKQLVKKSQAGPRSLTRRKCAPRRERLCRSLAMQRALISACIRRMLRIGGLRGAIPTGHKSAEAAQYHQEPSYSDGQLGWKKQVDRNTWEKSEVIDVTQDDLDWADRNEEELPSWRKYLQEEAWHYTNHYMWGWFFWNPTKRMRQKCRAEFDWTWPNFNFQQKTKITIKQRLAQR